MAICGLCCWQLPLHILVLHFSNIFSLFQHIFPCLLSFKYNFASSLYIRESHCINYRAIDCVIPENDTITPGMTPSQSHSGAGPYALKEHTDLYKVGYLYTQLCAYCQCTITHNPKHSLIMKAAESVKSCFQGGGMLKSENIITYFKVGYLYTQLCDYS